MGKDSLKIKHSFCSSTTKYGETFFIKKLCIWGNTFFGGKFFRGIFYIGTIDQIMLGRKLMIKRFQGSIQVSFSSHGPLPGLLINYLKN